MGFEKIFPIVSVNLLCPKRWMRHEIFLRKSQHAFGSGVQQVKGSITTGEGNCAWQLFQPHWVCFIDRADLICGISHKNREAKLTRLSLNQARFKFVSK
ncbi:MAG: hypothetical protein ACTHMB_21420 [Candidatus Binatia bacterium]